LLDAAARVIALSSLQRREIASILSKSFGNDPEFSEPCGSTGRILGFIRKYQSCSKRKARTSPQLLRCQPKGNTMKKFNMKKTTAAAVAAAVGAALLLGGAGTLAYWSDTETSATQSISSGKLNLDAATGGTWSVKKSAAAAPV